MLNGIDRITAIRDEVAGWLEEHEYASVGQLQGSLSQRHVTFPAAFERAHYVRAVTRLSAEYIPERPASAVDAPLD
jgi:dihydroorotate dehydrogenase (fumarate)